MQKNTDISLNVKRNNLTLLYRALIALKSATRAEIAQWTQIGITAVRSLLEELRRKGEVVELSQDQSTGGRRATRYALNPETNRILALYYLDYEIIDSQADKEMYLNKHSHKKKDILPHL